jgi:hypothetical protein
MPLFFGEKRSAIRDYEAEIASTGLINTREVHFIQNSMA